MENESDISLTKQDLEELENLQHLTSIQKLLRFYTLRDKDVGKRLHDAIVSRMDIIADKIAKGEIASMGKESEMLMELLQKGQAMFKGMEAMKGLSQLNLKKEVEAAPKSLLEIAREQLSRKRDAPSIGQE